VASSPSSVTRAPGWVRGRRLRLHANDPDGGRLAARSDRDPGDQSTAADRHRDGANLRALLDDLETERARARDDVRVVKRMDETLPSSFASDTAAVRQASTGPLLERNVRAV